jgi:hypothetical protein
MVRFSPLCLGPSLVSELYALIAVVALFAIAINFALLKIEERSVKLLRI